MTGVWKFQHPRSTRPRDGTLRVDKRLAVFHHLLKYIQQGIKVYDPNECFWLIDWLIDDDDDDDEGGSSFNMLWHTLTPLLSQILVRVYKSKATSNHCHYGRHATTKTQQQQQKKEFYSCTLGGFSSIVSLLTTLVWYSSTTSHTTPPQWWHRIQSPCSTFALLFNCFCHYNNNIQHRPCQPRTI